MYEKFEAFCGSVIIWFFHAGLMAAGYLLCLGPAWAANVLTFLRLGAGSLDRRMSVLLNKRVNRVPPVLTVLAAAQIITIAAIACMTCVSSPIDAAHIIGSILIGSFSIWAVCGAGRDAKDAIRTVKSSSMMKGCLMIEREVWN